MESGWRPLLRGRGSRACPRLRSEKRRRHPARHGAGGTPHDSGRRGGQRLRVRTGRLGARRGACRSAEHARRLAASAIGQSREADRPQPDDRHLEDPADAGGALEQPGWHRSRGHPRAAARLPAGGRAVADSGRDPWRPDGGRDVPAALLDLRSRALSGARLGGVLPELPRVDRLRGRVLDSAHRSQERSRRRGHRERRRRPDRSWKSPTPSVWPAWGGATAAIS